MNDEKTTDAENNSGTEENTTDTEENTGDVVTKKQSEKAEKDAAKKAAEELKQQDKDAKTGKLYLAEFTQAGTRYQAGQAYLLEKKTIKDTNCRLDMMIEIKHSEFTGSAIDRFGREIHFDGGKVVEPKIDGRGRPSGS